MKHPCRHDLRLDGPCGPVLVDANAPASIDLAYQLSLLLVDLDLLDSICRSSKHPCRHDLRLDGPCGLAELHLCGFALVVARARLIAVVLLQMLLPRRAALAARRSHDDLFALFWPRGHHSASTFCPLALSMGRADRNHLLRTR